MMILGFLLLAAALAAALLAAVQQGRELRRMREDLEALARPRLVAEPNSEALHGPGLFTGLYEEQKPGMLTELGGLPGVRVVGIAVALGLLGSALTTLGASPSPAPVVAEKEQPALAPDSLALVAASRDSLALVVAQLRDSVKLLAATTVSQGASAPRPKRPARPASKSGGIAPPPVLPPAPKLP